MPIFKYRAKKGVDEIVEGVVTAENQAAAVSKLIQQGLFPVEVELELYPSDGKDFSLRKNKNRFFFGLNFFSHKAAKRRIKFKDLFLFTQKLATLSRARMELLRSLKIVHDQTDDSEFKEIIIKIHNNIKEGRAFSKALEDYPAVFSPLFVSIVKAGEATGNIAAAFTQLTDFMRMQQSLRNKVSAALIYPAVLSCVGIVSVVIMLNFVIPRLGVMFSDLEGSTPLITQVILTASRFTTKYGLWVLFCLSVTLLMLPRRRDFLFSSFFRKLVIKMPVIKNILKNQELVNFSRAFSLLINKGVTPLQSLEIASLGINDTKIKSDLEEIAKRIKKGDSMYESLSSFKSLPDFFVKMIGVGEEAGRLGEVFDEISFSCSEQIESDINTLGSILEPLLILIIGSVLGIIILAILLPIFQMTQMIR